MNEKRVLYYEFETPISAFLDGKDISLKGLEIQILLNIKMILKKTD